MDTRQFSLNQGSALTAICLLLLISAPAAANELSWLLRLGIDDGGDRLARGIDEDGDHQSIKAGGRGYIEAGISYRLHTEPGTVDRPRPPLDVELTVGFKSDQIEDDVTTGGDINFERWTVGALVWARWRDVRFGLGPTLHFNPVLHYEGAATSFKTDSTFGLNIAADYAIINNFQIGTRAIVLEYEGNNGSSSANSFGMYLSFLF